MGVAYSPSRTYASRVSDEPREVRFLVGSGSIEEFLAKKLEEETQETSKDDPVEEEPEPLLLQPNVGERRWRSERRNVKPEHAPQPEDA
jgi:hypothetical protein